ncbi:MAG: hypothetical protein Tsb0013_20130 [Phycisphaerales bacterium]
MRVLMLGWEFPPFISGGLGTACYGLTRAMDALGHDIRFVLPRSVHGETASHVRLIAPDAPPATPADAGPGTPPNLTAPDGTRIGANPGATAQQPGPPQQGDSPLDFNLPGFDHTRFTGLPSDIIAPYPEHTGADEPAPPRERPTFEELPVNVQEALVRHADALRAAGVEVPEEWFQAQAGMQAGGAAPSAGQDYAGDVMTTAQNYAQMALRLCAKEEFDVIHAHDWMTYPAGMALARATGKPMVAHIHSTEFDRSGEHVNQKVYDIERRGMHAAARVIAVSELTRQIVAARYSVDPKKIDVVYNGVEQDGPAPLAGSRINPKDKIVLFLGRITMQKGPEYFIDAAKRVLDVMPNVKFLVAGSGDMARSMIEHAAELGIGHKVLFTGFLRGPDVARVFRMADLYVMPSVSEPFGIAPLEAMSNDTPVLISKQSGVSEVLTHALKVDFWDTREMANKIVAVLRHPPLGQTLREHGAFELHKLTWEGAAKRCVKTYEHAIRMVDSTSMPGAPAWS